MNDTIVIHQSFTMPAIKGGRSIPVDVDGYAVVNGDSLHEALLNIRDSLSLQQHTLEEVVKKVDDFSKYGVGFDDTLGVIAIPLIIALFAFAFTFLFTVITRINNDFESVPISRMFASSRPYSSFMKASISSVVFVIVVGVVSLLLSETDAHNCFMRVVNFFALFVALWYTLSIFKFVKTCIRYNDPPQLIDLIDERYNEDMKGVKKFLKKQKKEEHKNEKEKSEHRRYFKNMGFWYSRVYAGFDAGNARIVRLVDLFKYALRKNNNDLVIGVIQRIDNLIKEEKRAGEDKDIHYAMEFFDKSIDAYLSYPQNKIVDQELMLYWASSFNRSQLPSNRYVYRTLRMMVEAVTHEHYSLFEEYVSNVSYAFGYVNRLATSCYVRGGTVEEQISKDKERLEFWPELREMHFLVSAHLFSLGHFNVLRTLMYRKEKGFADLFPNTGLEILKLYARCKSKQTGDNNFNYFLSQDVIGNYPDPEMLEKFTSALLLIASNGVSSITLIGPTELGIIKKNKKTIVQFGLMWQGNEMIQRQNSMVTTLDIARLIDQYIKIFEESANRVTGERVKRPCTRFFQGILQFLNVADKVNDLYGATISERTKEDLGIHYWNWLYGNKSYLGNGLIGPDSVDKTSLLSMGVYTYLVNKQVICKPDGPDVSPLHNEATRIFSNRFQRLLFQAIQGMKIKEVRLKKDKLGDYIAGVLEDKGKDYVIVEVEMSLLYFVAPDKVERRGYPWRNSFKEAEIHPFELDNSLFLRDCADLEPFRDSILIIRKDYLPALEGESADASPLINYEDKSDRTNGIAAIRVTINPMMVVKYNPKSEVIRIRLIDYR